MKEMAILQGFSTHKLKLDYQSSKLMEEIRDGMPATEAGMVYIRPLVTKIFCEEYY